MKPILKNERDCWKTARADRWRLLVDGDAYFRAFREAALKAKRLLVILGWDIDSRLELCRTGCRDGLPSRLGPLLNHITTVRPKLNVHILLWDFAMIYSFDRQLLPLYHFGWKMGRRVHFHMDSSHPMGASHHQKIVLIDDRLAFSGGIDLSSRRWDTPDHLPGDARRYDPGSGEYRPLHDLQVMVEGPAARVLGDVARDRFKLAGLRLPPAVPASEAAGEYWPEGFAPELENVDVCVSRTLPRFLGQPEVREVEAQYLDAIGSARKYIFIENQYLTCNTIGQSLMERLMEQDGPEIVILLPHGNAGWLEEATMGVLRRRLIESLRAADTHHRLAVWSPMMRHDGEEVYIKVHAKLMIVDGRYLRVGSSNLNNRSMGLDTECDVSIQDAGREDVRAYIETLLAKLLSEHSGVELASVRRIMDREKSLVRTVAALADEERVPGKVSPHIVLRETDAKVDELYEDIFPGASFVDPERPANPEKLLSRIIEGDIAPGRPILFLLGLIGAPLAIWVLWNFTPLSEILTAETIAAFWTDAERQGYAVLLVLAAYIVGGQLVFPVTLLIAATAIAFPPLTAILYSLAGSFLSALLGYGMGMLFGRDLIRRLAGRRINRLSARLARKGLAAVATLRILPIAPFTLVNFVAGASGIGLRDYVAGTFVGMAPGIVSFTMLGASILSVFKKPDFANFLVFLGALALPFILSLLLQRAISKRNAGRDLPTA